MRFIFHVGLHKTGTTFIQKDILPRLEEVNYVSHYESSYSLFSSQEDKTILSSELLSGHPFHGRWVDEFERNMNNISLLSSNPECIIGFRRHDRLIMSLYKLYLHSGRTKKPEALFSPEGTGLIGPEDLIFERRLNLIEALFGRLLVYTLEEIKENLSGFLQRLTRFLDVPPLRVEDISIEKRNVGIKTEVQAKILRFLNRINKGLHRIPGCPTMENRLFRRLRLTPRDICQYRIAGASGTPLRLPEETEEFLRTEYADDWKTVQSYLRN